LTSEITIVKAHASAEQGQLDIPQVILSTYGRCVFSYDGPSAWNALPNSLEKQYPFSVYF